jgi:lycopene elongase/hydratase (dihydrobisanhydrobacterioruberin-forming)
MHRVLKFSLLRVSRPRFWTYVLGPFAVGLAATKDLAVLTNPLAYLFFLYFTLPANVLIYGINDIFDWETDVRNAKKTGYEAALPPDERPRLWKLLALTQLPFFVLAYFLPRGSQLALLGFVFLSVFYSAPPIRAKSKPFLDASFNFLYVCPGIVGFLLPGPQKLSLTTLLAGWCWVMAMQLFSAVPDITADRESETPTTATTLGLMPSLILCLSLYLAAAALAYPTLGWLTVALGAVYATLMALAMRVGTEEGVMRLYRYFPWINTLCGAILFFRAAL